MTMLAIGRHRHVILGSQLYVCIRLEINKEKTVKQEQEEEEYV